MTDNNPFLRVNTQVFGIDDDLTFGAHKGRDLGSVISMEPSYIVWALDNVEWFTIDDEAQKMLDDVLESEGDQMDLFDF